MTSPEGFVPYTRLADELIGKTTKDQLADAAKILALNIGWYHQRYGDVPQGDLLRMVRRETLGEQGKRLVLHGTQNLVSALAEMMGIGEDGTDEAQREYRGMMFSVRRKREQIASAL